MQILKHMQSTLWMMTALFAATLITDNLIAAPGSARERAKQSGRKSLDEQLLEDLGDALRQPPGADDRTDKDDIRASDARSKPAAEPSKARSLDDELLEGLEGEDVSLSANQKEENPLVRLNQRMKQVEKRIAEAHSDTKTQRLQNEISDDLRKIIAELERQCSQCKKQSSASSRPQAGKPKPGTNPAQQASEKPAQDSSNRMQEKDTAKADRAKVQEMLKDVWGHLPPHLRQQMEQSANEEFLPKYELEIADYYRSLLSGRREKK
jgi:hypothetical protein